MTSWKTRSGTRSGLAGWPNAPVCWAARWELESTPGRGTRIRAGSRRRPRRPTRSIDRADPCGSWWSTITLDPCRHRAAPRERDPGLHVVGEAVSGAEAFTDWRALGPDVVLMDLQMLDGDGIDAITRIRAEDAEASVIAVLVFASDELVAGVFRAGARGHRQEASGMDLAQRHPRGCPWRGRGVGTAVERLLSHLDRSADVVRSRTANARCFEPLERGPRTVNRGGPDDRLRPWRRRRFDPAQARRRESHPGGGAGRKRVAG